MQAVVNTTPLIALAQIDQLDILHQLFTDVLIPEVVFEECIGYEEERPGASVILGATWLQRHRLAKEPDWNIDFFGLDRGERDVLRLAETMRPDWVVIDEKLGRRVAQAMGFPVKGTLGILLSAYRQNILTRADALDALQSLEQSTVRISQRWLDWFRAQIP